MTEFTHVEGQEVWIHGRRVGIIVEEWFYPVPGAQLSAVDLGEIAKDMESSSSHNPAYVKPEISEFHVLRWYNAPDGQQEVAINALLPEIAWPEVGTTIRLEGELYTLEKIWPRSQEFLGMRVMKLPPTDFRREHQNEPATFKLDKKSMEQAKGRMHRRPVENDQSDSVSRSMKPSGGL